MLFYLKEIKGLSEEELTKKVHNRYPNLLYQMDLEGNIIKIWKSASDVEKEMNYSQGNIACVCDGNKRSAYGFLWAYQKDIKTKIGVPVKDIYCGQVKVRQYTLSGKYIKTWNCMSDAERELGVSNSKISSCCKRKRYTAGGFQWRYDNEGIEELSDVSKPLVICNETGVVYKNISRASKDCGLANDTIKKSCNGVKIRGKYSFRYYYNE